MKIKHTWLILFILPLAFSAKAAIKLPSLFTDNMILQQQTEVPIWGWDDAGNQITVTTSWNQQSYSVEVDKNGQWKVKVSTPAAGGPYEIEVKEGTETKNLKNVLIGEVWLCTGQSNMEMPLKGFPGMSVNGGNEAIVNSNNSQIRLLHIPRKSTTEKQTDFEGKWHEAAPQYVADFSATGWFFGTQLQKVLQVPVGLIEVSYGGSNIEAWMSQKMLKDFKDVEIPKNDKVIDVPNRTPIVLYNGMLAPVIGYGIKGCIWYQGESNYERPFEYQKLFKEMVKDWRDEWGQGEFPFYYAQIAPFNYAQFHPNEVIEKNNSAYLREAQFKASKEIPNSGMAVLMDIGERNKIHPVHKAVGGHRLAYLALAKTYGYKGFEYESPEFNAMEIKGSTVIVSFNNVPNGITSYGKEVTGFEIAGEDKVFYPAKCVLRHKSVMLASPKVEKPVAMRYLFTDYAKAELFSTGGLPVSSFRTDNW